MEYSPQDLKIFEEAQLAEQILDNTYFQEKISKLTQQLFAEWDGQSTVEEREQIWLKLQAIKLIIGTFKEPILMREQQLQTIQENEQWLEQD
jgi:hypothetical protein